MSRSEKKNPFGFINGLFKKKPNEVQSDPGYIENLKQYDFMMNSPENAIPETKIYSHVHAFLDKCSIKDSKAVGEDGRVRKVLFLGFDGMRPDMLPLVCSDSNNAKTDVGGIDVLRQKGGIYFGYCGGETDTKTQETTSTSASWTSQFTGVWGEKHSIKTNDDTKNLTYKTFMLEYAEKGLHTSLAFAWDQYFDVNLKEEVKYVYNRSLPMTFCDIDRVKKTKLEKTRAETLELYNFVTPEKPVSASPYDVGIRDFVIDRINADDSVICAIFDSIDSAGHRYGFGVSGEYKNAAVTCDMYSRSVLDAEKERVEKYNEEWLCIFANDHGGLGRDHGRQNPEEKMTWIATNIPIE